MERKEAIEVIKKNWPDSGFTMLREALETLIPELAESESERIRKEIVQFIQMEVEDEMVGNKWLAWLEKQGEKFSWSEEDEYQINTILHGLDLKRAIYKKEGNKAEEERYNTQYNWLKSLKDKCKGV